MEGKASFDHCLQERSPSQCSQFQTADFVSDLLESVVDRYWECRMDLLCYVFIASVMPSRKKFSAFSLPPCR